MSAHPKACPISCATDLHVPFVDITIPYESWLAAAVLEILSMKYNSRPPESCERFTSSLRLTRLQLSPSLMSSQSCLLVNEIESM